MKLEIKPKDRILLVVACSALIVVLMFRLGIFPAMDAYEAKKTEYDEKCIQAERMQKLMDDMPVNEERISEGLARLEELSGDCYEMMENRQIDALVTGVALKHDLFPSNLSISEQTTGIPPAYLYSATDGGSTAGAGTGSGTEAAAASSGDAAAGNVTGGDSGSDSEAAGDVADDASGSMETGTAALSGEIAGGAVCSVEASIVMSGSESNMKAFLDDIEENYPAVHVKSFDMSENVYMNTQMEPVTEVQMNAVLEIYMYNRPQVQ